MKRFIEEQIGKVLLVLAVAWVGLTWAFFPTRSASFSEETELAGYRQDVRVVYAKGELAPPELFFPVNSPSDYQRPEVEKWVRRKTKEKEFEGIPDLPEVTRAKIVLPPQLLPDPGPSLKGADKLPRWGAELPPLQIPQQPSSSGKGAGARPKTGSH